MECQSNEILWLIEYKIVFYSHLFMSQDEMKMIV